MAQHNKICDICKEKGHSKFYCKNKPYKPIPRVSKKRLENPIEKKRTPIKNFGKKAQKSYETTILWKKENPPNPNGLWYCKVGGYPLSDGRSEVEWSLRFNMCHDKSRARYPSLAYELSNLFAGCPMHNREQGSMDLEEYLSTDYTKKCANY